MNAAGGIATVQPGAGGATDAAVVPATGVVAPSASLLNGHVWDRIAARLMPWERGQVVMRVMTIIRAHPAGAHAVRVMKLGSQRGSWDTSNGDEVWVIVRDMAVKTVMLRRSSQPRSSEALQVDRVHL